MILSCGKTDEEKEKDGHVLCGKLRKWHKTFVFCKQVGEENGRKMCAVLQYVERRYPGCYYVAYRDRVFCPHVEYRPIKKDDNKPQGELNGDIATCSVPA